MKLRYFGYFPTFLFNKSVKTFVQISSNIFSNKALKQSLVVAH